LHGVPGRHLESGDRDPDETLETEQAKAGPDRGAQPVGFEHRPDDRGGDIFDQPGGSGQRERRVAAHVAGSDDPLARPHVDQHERHGGERPGRRLNGLGGRDLDRPDPHAVDSQRRVAIVGL